MPKKSLTELTLKTLSPPARGQVAYWDTHLPGFSVRVSQGGAKTFTVVYGPDRRRKTIGRYPLMSLAVARKRAREVLLQASLDPNGRPSLLFDEALEIYFRVRAAELRPRTLRDYQYVIRAYFRWTSLVEDISTNDCLKALDAITAPSQKAHAYTAIKIFFNWCVARDYCEKNPLARVPKPKTAPPRERVLDEHELQQLWSATHEQSSNNLIIRLLLLTGQRANQIASLRPECIDFKSKLIRFPAAVMKSNREHTLPFGPLTEFHLRAALPAGEYLFGPPGRVGLPFSTWSRLKSHIDESSQIDPWTLHDLRRTWATLSAKLGTEPHIIERVLAHAAGGTISKIAAIYNRFKYEDQMRDAIIRYENHIVQLCASM